MSRTVPSAIVTALSQPDVKPFYAVEALFSSGAVRFWTGYGERVIEGNTYLGAGELLKISGLEEVSDMSAKSASVTLSGIPGSIISLALQEPYQNRPCRILFGVTDVDDIVEVFSGTVDEMPIDDGPETGTIIAKIESKWVRLGRANIQRYTSESQKSRYPTDTFFDWVADLQDKDTLWGRSSA